MLESLLLSYVLIGSSEEEGESVWMSEMGQHIRTNDVINIR